MEPVQAVNLQDSPWKPSNPDLARRDFFTEFMYTVVCPLTVAFILFIILSIAMFGRRQGVNKRNDLTPEPQLIQFDTIRRATTNLRFMSNRRDGPPGIGSHGACSTPNLPIDHGTSQAVPERGQSLPPPPYRLPPGYSPHSTQTLPRHGSASAHFSHSDTYLSNRDTLPIRSQH